MRINEDFWDNNKVEKPEDREIPQDNLDSFHFNLSMGLYKDAFDKSADYLSPDSIEKYLKHAVNYIKNSPVFSDSVINLLTVVIRCKEQSYDKEFFHMPFNDYVEKIPESIFGIPVIRNYETDYEERLITTLKIDFNAVISLHYPADIYRFCSTFLYPRQNGLMTTLRIYPLFDLGDRANNISFIGRGQNGMKQMPFHIGSYTSIVIDMNKIDKNSFISLYNLFMSSETLVAFNNYIRKLNKVKEFPMSTIKKIIDENNDNQ